MVALLVFFQILTFPEMETYNEKPMVDLKRGIGDTNSGRKKQKLEKGEEMKKEFEMELDEKVATGCKAELEPSEHVLSNLKVEKVSQTLPLHTGARWSLWSDFQPIFQRWVFSGFQLYSLALTS